NRNNIDVVLNGPGSHSDLFGLYMGKDRQHFDNRTLVHHAAPHSSSNQVYKGILDEHSRGVFNGQILVDRDAQQVNAEQLNRNLLLSDNARADSKPLLKIFADDVKCSHGATVGQLDDNALFYLKSRGIGEDTAKSMLTYAFAADIVESVIVGPVRFYLYSALLNRLGKGWEQL
ncbi:MAG: SufD family Fe-S cluster assembly protein, partial [Candidatus Marinimicrobia bacterium]|nr:SufD family Fe-S cluster assembly protein [Candidatus Neomarinimicrobiota bacterium]